MKYNLKKEFVVTMAKLGVDDEIIVDDSDFYFGFVSVELDYGIVLEATRICSEMHLCRHINDIMHVYLAQKAKCKKLITYDKGFEKLTALNKIPIEIL